MAPMRDFEIVEASINRFAERKQPGPRTRATHLKTG
jgi:hypothetical protein